MRNPTTGSADEQDRPAANTGSTMENSCPPSPDRSLLPNKGDELTLTGQTAAEMPTVEPDASRTSSSTSTDTAGLDATEREDGLCKESPIPTTAVDMDEISWSTVDSEYAGDGNDAASADACTNDVESSTHNNVVSTPRTIPESSSLGTSPEAKTTIITAKKEIVAVRLPSKRATIAQRCEPSHPPTVADPNRTGTARMNKLACALKALKCSSRASEVGQDEIGGGIHRYQSDYETNLVIENYARDRNAQAQSLPPCRRQTLPTEGHRNMQSSSQHLSESPQPMQGSPYTRRYMSTAAIDRKIAAYVNEGVTPPSTPPSSRRRVQQISSPQSSFADFANFDSLDAIDARESNAVSAVLIKVAEGTTSDRGPHPSHPTTHYYQSSDPMFGIEIFSDENDDDEVATRRNPGIGRLHQQRQFPSLPVSPDAVEEDEEEADEVRVIFDSDGERSKIEFNGLHEVSTVGAYNGFPCGTATEFSTHPAVSCIQVRQPSNDSNETPTTCNCNPERAISTPTTYVISILDEDGSTKGKQGAPARNGDEKSLKQILHHNLSLGDDLSPTDQGSPTIRQVVRQSHTDGFCKEELLTTIVALDSTLQLPDTFGPTQYVGLQQEEKKVDDDSLHQVTSPFLNRNTSMERRSSHKSANVIKNGSVRNLAMDCKVQMGVPNSGKDRDNASSSTVSSFTITSKDGKLPFSKRQSPLLQKSNRDGHKAVTPHPFFWRSHPNVTFKSYHFQQPKPRIRRIAPKLEPVRSSDSFSTYGLNCRTISSQWASPASMEDSFCKGESTIPATQKSESGLGARAEETNCSPYLHPAVVRKMWTESQQFELKVNSNWQQHRIEGSNRHPQGQPSGSAQYLLHSFASFANRNMSAVFNRQQTDRSLFEAQDSPKAQ